MAGVRLEINRMGKDENIPNRYIAVPPLAFPSVYI
jgi:hypothetical protein